MTSFSPSVYEQRIEQAQQLIAERGLGGLVIGTGPELAYLTGSWISSHERLTCLVLSAQQATLIAPTTDIAEAEGLNIEVLGWDDGEDAHALAVAKLGAGAVGLGSSLTADHVLALQEKLADREFVLATDALSELFTVKEDAEIEQLREAGQAIDKVHAQVPTLLRAGRTEAEVAAELNHLILAEHDAVDFIIVGSGPNGANPHHSFSDRVLEPGDPVVVDIGGTYGMGYHSDCTRMYVVAGAEPPEEFQKAFDVLHRAYKAAVQSVRPGVSAQSVDAVARDIIAEGGYGEYFSHRTGHGIGLSGHEQPFIIAGNDLELQKGMAFSIEPGIYVPGRWGMRIEDIVTVTDSVERLNLQPSEYIIGS